MQNNRSKATPRGRRNRATGRWRKASALALAGVTLVGLAVAGEGELAGVRLRGILVDDLAYGIGVERTLDPIQDHLGYREAADFGF